MLARLLVIARLAPPQLLTKALPATPVRNFILPKAQKLDNICFDGGGGIGAIQLIGQQLPLAEISQCLIPLAYDLIDRSGHKSFRRFNVAFHTPRMDDVHVKYAFLNLPIYFHNA